MPLRHLAAAACVRAPGPLKPLGELDQVAGLDLALELGHRSLRGLQSGRERRGAAARVELALETTGRDADLVQSLWCGELRRFASLALT